MWNFALAVLFFLLAIAVVVGLFRFSLWVFAKLKIEVPSEVIQIIGVILVIIIAIWFVMALAGMTAAPWRLETWR